MPTEVLELAYYEKKAQRLFFRGGHRKSTAAMAVLVVGLVIGISIADRHVQDASLGVLYVLPILLASLALSRWMVTLLTLTCSSLCWFFDASLSKLDSGLYFVFAFLAFFSVEVCVAMLRRNHDLVLKHLGELRCEQTLRRDAEEQLTTLVKSSPAGILTLDGNGVVLAANEALHRLLETDSGYSLKGRSIREHLPVLVDALQVNANPFHTAAQCQARKQNGDVFLAHMWFSTYQVGSETQLAAIVIDASEEMRDREEQSMKQLSSSVRVTAAAISHEVRNFCGAISMLLAERKLKQKPLEEEELRCFEDLVKGLEHVAALDLKARTDDAVGEAALQPVMDDLRIVIQPDWQDIDGSIEWDIPERLPKVVADPHALLQVFLNLARNSHRVLEGRPERVLTVSAAKERGMIVVRFRDSGPGVSQPARLFKPFQEGAHANGMGLYISRAILRTFGGDLRYESGSPGACFAVELAVTK